MLAAQTTRDSNTARSKFRPPASIHTGSGPSLHNSHQYPPLLPMQNPFDSRHIAQAPMCKNGTNAIGTPPPPPSPRPRCSHCHNPTPLYLPRPVRALLRNQRGTSYLANSLACYLAILDAEVRDTSPGKGRQSPVEERILFPCSVCREVTYDGECKRARRQCTGSQRRAARGRNSPSGDGGMDEGGRCDFACGAPRWTLTPCPAEVGWLVCGRCWGGGRPGDAGASQMSEADSDFDGDLLEDELKPLDLDGM